jgi:hypothetical protein
LKCTVILYRYTYINRLSTAENTASISRAIFWRDGIGSDQDQHLSPKKQGMLSNELGFQFAVAGAARPGNGRPSTSGPAVHVL